jgi:regulator of protease activity HflC (stomatin/prohibitin superfamily)
MSDTEKEMNMTEPTPVVSNMNNTEFDPGNKALAEALRISFVVLKIVMICVIGFFVYGGLYKVEQNERALVLRFGRVVGGESRAIKQPGFHWAWPYPIEEIVKIPASNTERQLRIESFWYYQTPREKLGIESATVKPQLEFVRDGYSLTASQSAAKVAMSEIVDTADTSDAATKTGKVSAPQVDYNLVHTKWIIRYQIVAPLNFVDQLWDGTEKGWSIVEVLLQNVLCDSVIQVSANRDIDWMIWDATFQFREEVQALTAKRLAALGVGLDVKLDLEEIKWPRQVKGAFEMAASAKIEKSRLVTEARAQENEIVSAAEAESNIMIAEAEAYRSKIRQSAQADAKYLQEILARIDKSAAERVPDENDLARRDSVYNELLAVTIDQLYQEVLRDVIDRADETFVLNSTDEADAEWRLQLSRDKNLQKRKVKEEEKKGKQPPVNYMQK